MQGFPSSRPIALMSTKLQRQTGMRNWSSRFGLKCTTTSLTSLILSSGMKMVALLILSWCSPRSLCIKYPQMSGKIRTEPPNLSMIFILRASPIYYRLGLITAKSRRLCTGQSARRRYYQLARHLRFIAAT